MKQKINNFLFLFVAIGIRILPFLFFCSFIVFREQSSFLFLILFILSCSILVLKNKIWKTKFIQKLLLKSSYIHDMKILEKKIKRTYIVALILIVIVVGTIYNITKKETRTFAGYTIDEVLLEKYPEYDCHYINYNNYYYVILENDDPIETFGEIIRYNDNNEYEFNLFLGKFGNKVLRIEETADFFIICKDKEDNYLIRIMFTTDDLSQSKIKIYDNNETWQFIETSDGTRNYFKVISNIEDDYQITIEGYGKVYNISEQDIVDLFK